VIAAWGVTPNFYLGLKLRVALEHSHSSYGHSRCHSEMSKRRMHSPSASLLLLLILTTLLGADLDGSSLFAPLTIVPHTQHYEDITLRCRCCRRPASCRKGHQGERSTPTTSCLSLPYLPRKRRNSLLSSEERTVGE
jgi:hypothetical protein